MINDPIKSITIWLGATRYYLGRMTYAVSDFCECLIAEWPNLPEEARNLIKRDIEEEFVRDDDFRSRIDEAQDLVSGIKYLPLGMDCDRKQWERVRALWS